LSRERHAVGLTLLGGEARERYLPPRTAPDHARRLLATLDSTKPRDMLDFTQGLREVAERQKRRAIVFLFSDLMAFPQPGPEGAGEPPALEPLALLPLKLLAARGHDVILFHTFDPAELSFPYEEMTEFEDLEDGGKLLVDASGIREAYLAEIKDFCEGVKRSCEGAGVEYRRVTSELALDGILLDFFAARRRALRR
jgi:hypothetical protein